MPWEMESLFDICLEYVARNAHKIDSLEGFPIMIGEKIFQKCVDVKIFEYDDVASQILSTFSKAYGKELLVSLYVDDLVMLNEWERSFKILFKNIVHLDLKGIHLGPDNELLPKFCKLPHLESLCLARTHILQQGIKRMLCPWKFTGKGFSRLKYLDISGNYNSAQNLNWIFKLNLNILRVSYLEEADRENVELWSLIEDNPYYEVLDNSSPMKIEREGLAKSLLSYWDHLIWTHNVIKQPKTNCLARPKIAFPHWALLKDFVTVSMKPKCLSSKSKKAKQQKIRYKPPKQMPVQNRMSLQEEIDVLSLYM